MKKRKPSKKRKVTKKNGMIVFRPTDVVSVESTGGAGYGFERQIQTLFAVLMICDGDLAFAPGRKIVKVQFQVRRKGYNLDDIRIEMADAAGNVSQVLVQAKRTISFTKSCQDFTGTIQAAWLDYCNGPKFNREADKLVLATGPLRDMDRGVLDWLLERARTNDCESLVAELRSGAGISADRRKFYEFICEIVRLQSECASDEEIVAFLRHLYVFFPDTVYGDGLLASFAISLVKKHFAVADADRTFRELESIVGRYNAAGGDLTKDGLLRELRLSDSRAEIIADAVRSPLSSSVLSLAVKSVKGSGLRTDHQAMLSLVGSWNDSIQRDREIVCECLGVDEDALGDLIQSLAQSNPPLVVVEHGVVRVKRRREIWRRTAHAVASVELMRFADVIVRQLSQVDKVLNSDPDERCMAGRDAHGIDASNLLREGLSQGLALFAADDDYCKQIPFDTRLALPIKVVRKILNGRDWKMWATLDDLLPLLAEAAPEEYLANVGRFVRRRVGGMASLYGQERRGVFGRTYILGLLNSLSLLAWFPDRLAESLRILSVLAKMDPDGQWHPRPIDLFQKALHPFAPHTWATARQRVDVFAALLKRVDGRVAWDAVSRLLPEGFFSYMKEASGPLYRGEGQSTEVGENQDGKEIAWQFERYCAMAVPLAGMDPGRLAKIENGALRHWSDKAFGLFVDHLRTVRNRMKVEDRYVVWRSICRSLDFVQLEDEKGGNTNWNHPRVKAYRLLEKEYAPSDVRFSALSLFSWDEVHQRKKATDDERTRVLREIYRQYGIDGMVDFAAKADLPAMVGQMFGADGDAEIDRLLLPGRMESDVASVRSLVSGYVAGRFSVKGWQWVESILGPSWTSEQVGSLLVMLPFCRDTWIHVSSLLKGEEIHYWRRIRCPYVEGEDDLAMAIDGLLSAGCGHAALDLVGHHLTLKHELPTSITTKVLQSFVDNKVMDAQTSMSYYNLGLAIKAVQGDDKVSMSVKAGIEWRFIESVNWIGDEGFRPVAMEMELASDPEFFCEALSIAYLPAKRAKRIKAELGKNPRPEREQRRIRNVWKLLYHWRTVPGVAADGSFDERAFKAWSRKAFALARKNDRLEPAKNILAQAFARGYPPKDATGFWMPRVIAELLERRGNGSMLVHYRMTVFNSRGVHFVDKTGKEDQELAAKYDLMAGVAEREGCFGLAKEMRTLAGSIRVDAARMKEEDRALDAYFEAKREERAFRPQE